MGGAVPFQVVTRVQGISSSVQHTVVASVAVRKGATSPPLVGQVCVPVTVVEGGALWRGVRNQLNPQPNSVSNTVVGRSALIPIVIRLPEAAHYIVPVMEVEFAANWRVVAE